MRLAMLAQGFGIGLTPDKRLNFDSGAPKAGRASAQDHKSNSLEAVS